jgi:serine/threonine protein kinase
LHFAAIRMSDINAPEAFFCSISFDIMSDPVILGSTGHSFEREEIEAWLENHTTNPLTNDELSTQDRILIPNHALRSAIEEFVESAAGRIIPSNEIVLGERLGSGSDKDVIRAKWGTVDVAILKFRQATLTQKEARMFVKLGLHPHLVQFFGRTFVDDDPPAGPSARSPNALVNECAPLGDLSTVLGDINDSGQTLSVSHLLLVAEQIADGMTRIHAGNILHRDLAGRNVMVFSLDREDPSKTLVKVGDYGLAEVNGAKGYLLTSGATMGPVRWMAPETIRRRKWSKQSDVYSFGVLLWEIFSYGAYPFNHLSSDEDVARGVRDDMLHLSQPANHCPNELWALAQRCMSPDASLRPTFNELKIQLQQLRVCDLTFPTAEVRHSSVGEREEKGQGGSVSGVLEGEGDGAAAASRTPPANAQRKTSAVAAPVAVAEAKQDGGSRQRSVSVGNRGVKLLVVGDSGASTMSSPRSSVLSARACFHSACISLIIVCLMVPLCSSAGVGKSCLLLRFCHPDHKQTSFITTIGVDFKRKTVQVEGDLVPVTIWDSAGTYHPSTAAAMAPCHAVSDCWSHGECVVWCGRSGEVPRGDVLLLQRCARSDDRV